MSQRRLSWAEPLALRGLARPRRWLLASAGAMVVLGWASTALAADATDTSQPATGVAAVTITAERRETKLQETPIADTVLTAQKLDDERVVSMQDVAINVPNLTYTQFSTQESYFSIRGTLINNNAAGWDDAVSTFIDDVPATGLGDEDPDLFDLASIEVLRGPQGTLFGRNVTGGAVVVHTLAPSFTFTAKAEGTYGSDNLAELRGYVSGPISGDMLAGKLSVNLKYRDNYVKNTVLGRGGGAGGTRQGDVRGQLLWKPSPDVEVLFGADYLKDDSGGYATKLFGNFQPTLFAQPLSYDPNSTNQGFNGFQHREIGGGLIRVTWTNPIGVFTSITGYRSVNEDFPNDLLGDPTDQIFADGIVQDRQFTQEFHLASRTDQRLTWLVGLFYLHANKREANPLTFNFSPDGILGGLSYFEQEDQRIAVDSVAAFGEATYAITDSLKLTLGGRATYEHKSGRSIVFYVPDIGLPAGDVTYARGWNSFTPKVTLTWNPTPGLMLYATVAEGYKSGGWDLSGQAGTTPQDVAALLKTPFNPETVWNYEVGEKYTGFDNHLLFDVTLFDAEYKNLQTNQLVVLGNGTLNNVTTNAAGARVRGVELESSLAATSWLNLGLTYAYMDARFTNFPGIGGNPSFTGNRIPYAPQHQVHVTGEVHFPIASLGGKVAVGADFTYHTAIFFNNANDTLPNRAFAYNATTWRDIINLYANFTTDDGRWKLAVWAKNVANDRALLHGADVTAFLINPAVDNPTPQQAIFLAKYYPEPTVGVTVTHAF
jgi:iron complex outermembrane receptor protein